MRGQFIEPGNLLAQALEGELDRAADEHRASQTAVKLAGRLRALVQHFGWLPSRDRR